jgi:hypothetical protein
MPMMAMKTVDHQAESHVLSTTFTVPQKKTVPSDNTEHKVTIATLNLTPVLHFDCVPSKNPSVSYTLIIVNYAFDLGLFDRQYVEHFQLSAVGRQRVRLCGQQFFGKGTFLNYIW